MHSTAAGPLPTALYITEQEGYPETTSFGYALYCLTAGELWTQKSTTLGSYRTYIIFVHTSHRHDVRVFVHACDSPTDVADRVLAAVSRFREDAGHVSTRDVTGHDSRSTFLEAVLQGMGLLLFAERSFMLAMSTV